MNIDDPKLTAFALDELDEAERSTIARAVADSPDAQRYVAETREFARALKNEFAAELTQDEAAALASRSDGFPAAVYDKRRSGERRSLVDIRDDPWFWSIGRPLAIAAAIAIFAMIAAIAISTYKKRSDSVQSIGVDYPSIEGQQSVPASVASDFSGSETIANPLAVEAIRRIEHVVIGELDVDPHLESGELRLIEVINDAYRIQRLKERLKIPVLSKKSLRSLAGPSYGLMFLDHSGRVVASARFYRLPDGGFVLQPLQNALERNGRYFIGRGPVVPGSWKSDVDYGAYAIPFSDWNECIGYAPSA
jgi:hypothetical protein